MATRASTAGESAAGSTRLTARTPPGEYDGRDPSAAAVGRSAADRLAGVRAGRRGWGRAVPAGLAVAPLVVLAVQLLWLRPRLLFGGDQALIELGVRDAGGLNAVLGVYSRFGWHHPGPVWLYLLAGPYRLLGGASWALVVSELLLSAGATVLIVMAASRLAGPPAGSQRVVAAWLTAGLLLVFFWLLGFDVLRGVWNPYAVVLPAVLFLLLATGATLGRPGWALGAALTGTFLAQTHVGTAVLVALTGLLVVVTRTVAWGRRVKRRPSAPPAPVPARRPRVVTASGLALLVLAWLPPLIDQVAGTGNLRALLGFMRHARPGTGWLDGASVAGQSLTRVYASRAPQRLESLLPRSGGLPALLVVVGLAAGLLLVGWRRAHAPSAGAGGVALCGLAAAVVSAHGIVGPLMPYLLLWTAALPVTLALGWAALLTHAAWMQGKSLRSAWLAATAVTASAAVAMVVVAVRVPSVAGFPEPAVARAAAAMSPQLAGQGLARQAVLVRPCGASRWEAAAGLVLELRRRGWPAYVPDPLVPLFGTQRRLPGRAHVEVIVANSTTAPGVAAVPGSRVLGGAGGRSSGLYYRVSGPGFRGSAEAAARGSERELAGICRRT